MRRTRLAARWTAAGAFALAAVAIRCDGPSGPPPDTASPVVSIAFPAGGEHDRDGDGLVDLEVTFADSGSGIDPESLVIETSRALGPNGTGGRDLLAAFRVEERSAERVVLEETTDAVLPDAEVQLTVRVRDGAGNTARASVTVDLPSAAFHTRLTFDPGGAGFRPFAIGLVPDGSLGIVPLGHGGVVLFDPRRLEVLETVPGGSRGQGTLLYDPGTARFYIVNLLRGELEVFDPAARRYEAPILLSGRAVGVARGLSGRLYVTLRTLAGAISVVDPVARAQVDVYSLGLTARNPQEGALPRRPAVPREEDRVYVPISDEPEGLAILDLETREVEFVDFDPSSFSGGFTLDTRLDESRGVLYLTGGIDASNGLLELDLMTCVLTRRLDAEDFRLPKFMAPSPDFRRLFVTLGGEIGTGAAPENWLVDVATFARIERLVEHIPEIRGDTESVFRPDGQLIFVVSGDDSIAVYLHRQ